MARKNVFTEEIMLEKTYDFIKLFGIEALNARDLCHFIGCSTQPLFKNFVNMDIFKTKMKQYLLRHYDKYVEKIIDKNDYLFSISYAYATFALVEPNVFKALFISDLAEKKTEEGILSSTWNKNTIKSIPSQYDMTLSQAAFLYRDVRFFTHGLACQIAVGSILVSEDEIDYLIRGIITKLTAIQKNKVPTK